MFSNGRARSGVIVLPCGAGKTLAGIAAACTIKKGTVVLCSSGVAVEQWRQQFLQWANVNSKIIRLTAKSKDNDLLTSIKEDEAFILISTYTMMSYQGTRSAES